MALVLDKRSGETPAAGAPAKQALEGKEATPPRNPRFKPLPMPDLEYTPEVAREMAPYYERVKHVIPAVEWPVYAPYVKAINELKKERNAVLLAHNYMTPEIFHCVGDIMGDSLHLAKEAARAEADVIVQCGVHFMAETSKILNPSKTVLMPDMNAGCSLAESITADGIAEMRAKYPGAPVVSYVNTTAEVKAASDICCTSANALQIVEAMESDTVIMTPDQYLAQNVAAQSSKKVVYWPGSCVVHELYTADELNAYRDANPGTKIVAHPECKPDVVQAADFTGSTTGMVDWVRQNRPEKVMLVTECSMAANVAEELPEVELTKPCNACPYMKMITLEKVLWSLHTMTEPVEVDPAIAENARVAVERMIDLSRKLGL